MHKETTQYTGLTLIHKLKECPPGIADAYVFEKLCCQILIYLFGPEFSQSSAQHCTHDGTLRMDLQCAISGKTEFWRFLKFDYKSMIVVWEFKNYSSLLDQDTIFTTKKYLCRTARRNVVFIISRKGFDRNAGEAALNTLHDSQLIMDLNDEDLIQMIRLKDSGQEPSEYLMRKLQRIFMDMSA